MIGMSSIAIGLEMSRALIPQLLLFLINLALILLDLHSSHNHQHRITKIGLSLEFLVIIATKKICCMIILSNVQKLGLKTTSTPMTTPTLPTLTSTSIIFGFGRHRTSVAATPKKRSSENSSEDRFKSRQLLFLSQERNSSAAEAARV